MRTLHLFAAAALAGGTMLATPAVAAEPTTCDPGSLSIFDPAATSCVGYYDGNVFDSSAADVTTQTNALAALGLSFTDFNDYLKIDSLNGSDLDFGTALSGLTIIGVHWGNVPDPGFNPSNNGSTGNVSAFLVFDLGAGGTISVLNTQGFSDAVLYQTGTLPEPATWAMMLLGFGTMGIAIRRSRRKTKPVSQLA